MTDATITDARELLRATLHSDPYATLRQMDEVGKQHANAKAQLDALKGDTKGLQARIESEIAASRSNESLSEATLKRLALCDPRTAIHTNGIKVATEAEAKLNYRYWHLKQSLELDKQAIILYTATMRLDR